MYLKIFDFLILSFKSLQVASVGINLGHPFHHNLETIFQKIPSEMKGRMNRRQLLEDSTLDVPSEKNLIRLHSQVCFEK